MFISSSSKSVSQTLGGERKICFLLSYILKHLEEREVLHVHIYCTWCDVILILKPHRRTRLIPRSSVHSLKIRVTSHPCNNYEQIMLPYLLSVKSKINSELTNSWRKQTKKRQSALKISYHNLVDLSKLGVCICRFLFESYCFNQILNGPYQFIKGSGFQYGRLPTHAQQGKRWHGEQFPNGTFF